MKYIPGINIQWPWSRKLISGKKTVETRSYPIPNKYVGKTLALIETPGPEGKSNGVPKARIIGLIQFSSCKKYENKRMWVSDYSSHRVPADHELFKYKSGVPKWGWKVATIKEFRQPLPAPAKRGIIFTSHCRISDPITKAHPKK